MTVTAIAWDTYSRQRSERRPVNSRGETTWFNWTQYEDHGPGAELLDLPAGGRVLDLGCGKGGNAVHLASLGMRAVGVDVPRAAACGRSTVGRGAGAGCASGTAHGRNADRVRPRLTAAPVGSCVPTGAAPCLDRLHSGRQRAG
ncbi:methyltransferase domain-containing protein [Streptomyces sp. NPDC006385]|uniref:SAM-dependent methyltransferase n=1 Tax=Streptomyces sp. NPDC006385 TaxID=3156761 RepID=UPI0033A2F7F9